ncbi:MAG TPA: PP2C family protein-serine/threonine phosphatase [Candidatus Sulfotelmatobacter sp.]|nr:PP2C family protein-serine/threonine phosphatase [Candidatus Sulfotelmatobacter sp.]
MRSLFRSRDREPAVIVEPVPTVFPPIAGADIAAVFAGKRVAGDFYDSVRVSPQRVLIGLLDVAGRRDDNRHLLTAAQEIFRTAGAELFSAADVNESDAMTELNHRLNRGLIDASSNVRSCPAFIACYHEVFGTLCYTNAGHLPGLLRDSTSITELDSTGLPLGLFSHATADARIVGLEKGAALLLVSRGLIACEGRINGSSEEFGLEGVKHFFQNVPVHSARELCDSILNSVNDFSGNVPLCDDRTALSLIRLA